MKYKIKFILFALLCVLQVKCTLEIYSPQFLKNQFTNNSIKYSVANFGHIPFGKTLIGKLVITQPISGCDKNQLSFPEYENPFLLIERGECTFVNKVQNAQSLGATLAIITDNSYEFGHYVVMKDDGNGYKITIPSIMIDVEDGKTLRELVAQTIQPIVLKIVFDTHKSKKVNLTLWLQIENRKSYKLIRNFAQNFTKLSDYINLDVVHKTTSCFFCREKDCYEGNSILQRYCAIPDEPDSSYTGKDIIDQQVRQKIVYQEYPTLWWKYMDIYDKQCSDLMVAKICSNKIFKQLKIDQIKIQSLIIQKRISVLRQNSEKLENGGITSYPSASINSMKVPGNLKSQYLTQQICSTLENPPSMCIENNFILPEASGNKASFILTIFLVIIIITVIFVISFCIYRRYIRRQLRNEVSSEVNSMVSKYIQFYSDRNNNT